VRLPLLLLATLACTDEPTPSTERGKGPDLVWELPNPNNGPPLRVGQFVLVSDGDDGCIDCNPLDQAVVVVQGKLWRLEVQDGNGDRVVSVTRDDSLGDRPLIVESFLLDEYPVPADADRLDLVRIP
jgi:hypothetical protein